MTVYRRLILNLFLSRDINLGTNTEFESNFNAISVSYSEACLNCLYT